MDQAVREARELLEKVTPLKRDCGRICASRCCRPLEGEETGMLLFPGEEEVYRDRPDWTLRETALGPMVLCPGRCEREERPLSCRLFPLLPCLTEDGEVRAAMDQRARAVCPLARQGKSALDPAFIEAVRVAGTILAAEEKQAAFLRNLSREQEELLALRRRWNRARTAGASASRTAHGMLKGEKDV